MKLTVDIIDDFIKTLDLSGDVRSFSDDGTDTTLIVDNTFHARKGMVLDIDGFPFTIVSIVFETSITVSGLPAAPFNYTVPLPFYFHGTPIATNNQIVEADHKDKVPMIYLHEILKEKDKDIFSAVKRDSDLRLFFLDSANFDDWTTDDHYSQRLLGLNALVDAFRDQALKSELFFLDETEFSRVNHVKWGTFKDLSGHIKNIFDDKLTGVELSLTLPLTDCEDKVFVPRLPCPDPEDPPDVIRLDDTTASAVSDDPIDVEDFLGTPDWEQMTAAFGRGYLFPEPNQVTSFRTGDESNIESTIFSSARAANDLKMKNSLASFFVLNNTNSFGTLVRHTDELGTEVFTNNLLIDNLTGLMFYTVLQSTDIWNDAIDAALASTQSGFSDWFMASFSQMHSIYSLGSGTDIGYNFAPFSIATSTLLHTSTTDSNPTTNAISTRGSWNAFLVGAKSISRQYLLCRKQF